MHLVPVPINVRCYSNSNPIVRRSEATLRANRRHEPARKRLAIKRPDIRLQIIRPQQCSNHLAARYSRALISSGRVLLGSAISSARLK